MFRHIYFLGGGDPAVAYVGELVIAQPLLHLVARFEDVEVQPFMPDCPVVALDIGILLGLADLYRAGL